MTDATAPTGRTSYAVCAGVKRPSAEEASVVRQAMGLAFVWEAAAGYGVSIESYEVVVTAGSEVVLNTTVTSPLAEFIVTNIDVSVAYCATVRAHSSAGTEHRNGQRAGGERTRTRWGRRSGQTGIA